MSDHPDVDLCDAFLTDDEREGELECGCLLERGPDCVKLQYCALHAAAPAIFEALESLLCIVCDEPGEGTAALLTERDPMIISARAAIRQATP